MIYNTPVTVVTQQHTGRTFKTGWRKSPARHMTLKLSNYIDTKKISLPDDIDYTQNPAAKKVLHQIMLNDKLGDCTAAGAFHIAGVWQCNAGKPVLFSNDQVQTFYSATTGYIPGRPETDQGGDETTVLNYWRDHGLYKDGHKILGHCSIDARDSTLVKSAIYLFENTYFGVGLPQAWCDNMPNGDGFTWNVDGPSVPNNGHCFSGFGYNSLGLPICTWGMIGVITWSAVEMYAANQNGGELHTMFGYDMINAASQKAPNSFKADELYADFKKFMAA